MPAALEADSTHTGAVLSRSDRQAELIGTIEHPAGQLLHVRGFTEKTTENSEKTEKNV